MNERVLFVDDEPQVLEGIQRSLRKHVETHTASSGAEGLRLLHEAGPFALVVSDMRMPGMSGVQFLAAVREQKPETVRMILSGHADLQATIAAVNEGHVYRFLSKPCAADQLLAAIEDGIRQYRLLTAEKVLLEQTLSGCVTMLIEILGMVSPAASSRASRLQRYTLGLARTLNLADRWQWGLAAFVSQIGCVALPHAILSKVEAGQALTDDERRLHESHPDVAGKLLASIPRLEDIADIVTAQFAPLSFAGGPEDLREWEVRSMGRLLLRTAVEFDRLIVSGVGYEVAVATLRASKLKLPGAVVDALRSIAPTGRDQVVKQVRLKDLSPRMILDEDLVSPKGIRLVPAGQEVTRSLIVRLNSIAGGVGVVEPFRVRVPT
ncbi:MAG TPA: response regulator [Steroidobacteraceae bacterium]|nr:response regulator [Steroidobacteraceae bacterium]